MRVGESGALYFVVDQQTYGPAGPSGTVTKSVLLSPESLTAVYAVADLTQDPDLTRYASNAEANAVLPVVEEPQN